MVKIFAYTSIYADIDVILSFSSNQQNFSMSVFSIVCPKELPETIIKSANALVETCPCLETSVWEPVCLDSRGQFMFLTTHARLLLLLLKDLIYQSSIHRFYPFMSSSLHHSLSFLAGESHRSYLMFGRLLWKTLELLNANFWFCINILLSFFFGTSFTPPSLKKGPN